jgi:hypothetical protein
MPANLVIYLVRHAEKPDESSDLSPAGQARATAYLNYFQNLKDLSGQDDLMEVSICFCRVAG